MSPPNMPDTSNVDDPNGSRVTVGTHPGSIGSDIDPMHDPNYKPMADAAARGAGAQYSNGVWWLKNKDGQWERQDKGQGGPSNVGQLADALTGKGDYDAMGNLRPEVKAARDAQAAKDAQASQTADITSKMQAFYKEMSGAMDQNDPVYQGLLQAGTAAAGRMQGSAGLAGRSTLAGTQSASVAQQNVLPWMQARQSAAANMLQNLSNRDISLANINLGQQQIDDGRANASAQAAHNTMQSIGSIGGGIIGGLYGGPGGMAIGSSLGGGALGAMAPAPNYSASGTNSGSSGIGGPKLGTGRNGNGY